MPRKWKVLELYGLETMADLVWLLLPILDGLTVEEQFKKQLINRVQKKPLSVIYGGAYVEKDTREWVILLNTKNSFEQHLFTLAHELAHIFAYEKRNWRWVDVWRTKGEQLEDFCDFFATEWLARNNNREQLVLILTKHLNDKVIYFSNRQGKVLNYFIR
ncbi:MAG: hypothetical protein G01um101444_36 [Parcubacteria group bacterium Gr01-1014_44]|nr:MAG: hypothetical protein G01um101444_36 [Parcubacteria group bacterium Gr01-1014_44]